MLLDQVTFFKPVSKMVSSLENFGVVDLIGLLP